MFESQTCRDAIAALLSELLDGVEKGPAYVVNPGDPGLLSSLDRLDHRAASVGTPSGGPPIAAHVDHLRYGISHLNRWSEGEDPFASANYAASWQRTSVTAGEWRVLRDELRDQAHRWRDAVRRPRAMDGVELRGMLGSVVHLAYHIGAIRQIDRATRGPLASD